MTLTPEPRPLDVLAVHASRPAPQTLAHTQDRMRGTLIGYSILAIME